MQQETSKYRCQLKETLWWSVSEFATRSEERLFSDPFKSSFTDEVTWRLCVYPNGSREVDRGHVSLFLYNGPDRKNNVIVTYVFSIMGADGQVLNENKSTKPWNYTEINANNGSGFPRLFNRDRIEDKLVAGALKIKIELTYEQFEEALKNYSIMACPKNFCSIISSNYCDRPENMFRAATAAITRLTNYEELIDNEDADFLIEFEDGKTIGLHKAILRRNWPYFSRLLNSKMTEVSTGKLIIVEHSYEAIKSMLVYVYSGAVRFVDMSSTLDLFKAAHQFLLEDLSSKCEQYALKNLARTSVIDCLIVAVKYDLSKLKDACLALLIVEKRVNKLRNLSDIPNFEQLACIENYSVFVELSLKFFNEIV